jgi:hypothetical protein
LKTQQKHSIIASTLAGLITGISISFVLGHFLISATTTFLISIVTSLVSFGLTRYYTEPYNDNVFTSTADEIYDSSKSSKNSILNGDQNNIERHMSNIIFVFLYLIFILICIIFSKPNLDIIYTSWNNISIPDIIVSGTGILLSFFIPGYALVLIIAKKQTMNPVLKVLLAYLSSMLITALTVYISAIYVHPDSSENKILLISVYLVILAVFVGRYRIYEIIFSRDIYDFNALSCFAQKGNNVWKILNAHIFEFLVFGGLFGLLVIYCYYVYGGITIGDQWYHQNRALLFMSGHFKESVLSDGDLIYPPFQSALLAGLSILSGIPLVNAFASMAFLNMTAVFAFYYFTISWLPSRMKRAALFASSLFLLASGFDWTYIIASTIGNLENSQISQISTFFLQEIRFSDLYYAPNFIIAAFPDFSTALIYIVLPAGFVLLGLIRFRFANKFGYTAIISIITILGILSHDEFYLFIIVSCILPLAFNIRKRNCIYLVFLFSFAFVYMIDGLLPVKYFTSTGILEIPLINLAIFYVLITWAFYIIRQSLPKIQQVLPKHFYSSLISSFAIKRRLAKYLTRFNFIVKVIPVWAVVYLIALSFLVWTQIPENYIGIQRDGFTTPWYFYPMRLGLVGLFGLASILSYIFRRFEKEVFVFGIIIIIALLMGPFYNEQRFTKYVMAGMIGFASVLIFKLLTFVSNRKPIINGIIIGLIVVFASLSTLMFVVVNDLIIQTHDYTYALARRNFPSTEEMKMLELMRSEIKVGSNTANIAALPYEHKMHMGVIMTKLHAFSGLPHTRILQTPLILNASTLDSFYHLLENTNTKYIIIPHMSINDEILPGPTRFALDNFQRIYDDANYQVLRVPSLHGPSQLNDNDIAIIYKKDKSLLPQDSDNRVLQFNNATFDFENDTIKFMKIKKENQIEKITLYGNMRDGGKTLWSKDLNNEEEINYIESKFRIHDENKPREDIVGLKWTYGEKDYVVYLSSTGLELRYKSKNNDDSLLLSKNTEIKKNNWTWYLIKVAILENSINVYLDDVLKIKVPRDTLEKNAGGITKIGINSVNNSVDFEPVQIAKGVESIKIHDNKNKYSYDYPLTALALSRGEYDVFKDDDYSVFSKKNIILPFDPLDWTDSKIKDYLHFAMSGGTLVVMNSDGNFNGSFSKFFSIEPKNNITKFTSIRQDNQHVFLNVSGLVRNVELKPSSDVNVIASYRNEDNKVIAPFAIEKTFDNNGRIIFINNNAYFDAINHNPKKYFLSLSNFSKLFHVNTGISTNPKGMDNGIEAFFGNVEMSGTIAINGSSFSLVNGPTNSSTMNVGTISLLHKDGTLQRQFKNVSIIDMKVFGRYGLLINAKGILSLLSSESELDYMKMLIPNEFNMTLNPLERKNTQIAIDTTNGTHINTIKVSNESKIIFYNIRSDVPFLNSVPVFIKDPEIQLNGNASFHNGIFYGDLEMASTPLHVFGTLKAKFDSVDHFNERFPNGIKNQDITYLSSITVNGEIKEDKEGFKLPGDISYRSKKEGLVIPLIDILSSSANIILLISLTTITIVASWLIRRIRVY